MSGSGSREIKFRIAADGSQGQQAYRDLAATGKRTYADLQAAANATTQSETQAAAGAKAVGDQIKSAADSWRVFEAAGQAATEKQMQSYLRLADIAKQQAGQDAAQRNFSSFMGIGGQTKSAQESASVFAEQIRLEDDLAARTARLRAEVDPLSVAQAKLAAETANANELFAKGRINTTELAAATTLAQRRFDDTRRSLGAMGDGGRLAGYQLVNLQYQINDIATGLASGQNPFTVMIQQGLQISQLMGPGSGGVSGLLRGVKDLVGQIATPARIGMGSVAALAGTVAIAFSQSTQEAGALGDVLQGAGIRAGATAGDIEKIARASSDASKISVAAAREIEINLLRTGKVGVQSFEAITSSVRKYAAITGESFDDAGKELTQAFIDPGKGIDALSAKIGGFDDATKQSILTLQAQGDQLGAADVLAQALARRLQNVSENTTILGRGWDFLTRNASDLWTAIKDHVNPSLEQNIDFTKQQIAFNQAHGLSTGDLVRNLATLEEQYRGVASAARESASAQAATDRINAGLVIARGDDPDTARRQAIANRLKTVNTALQNGPSMTPGPNGLSELQELLRERDRLMTEQQNFRTNAQQSAAVNQAEIDALRARTVAERGAAAETRARLELGQQGLRGEELEARVAEAGALARAQAAQAIDDETRALTTNAAAAFNSARAFLQSTAAGERAEAVRKALSESIRNGVDVETRARQILLEQAGETAAASARTIAQNAESTDAQKKLNDQIERGGLTIAEANNQMKIWMATRELSVALSEAEAAHDDEKAAAIRREIAAMQASTANDNAEAIRRGALNTESGQLDEIAGLGLAISLRNEGSGQREVELAQLRARQQLIAAGVDAESDIGKRIIANAGFMVDLNNQIQRNNNAESELLGAVDQAGSNLNNFLVQGKLNSKDLFSFLKTELQDISSMLIKMSLINPFENWAFGLTGSNRLPEAGDLLKGGAGGANIGSWISDAYHWIADLFHEGGVSGQATQQRPIPRAVFDRAPRYHLGFDPSTEQPAILLKNRERVLNPQETADYPNLVARARRNSANAGGLGIYRGGDSHFHVDGNIYGDAALKASMAEWAKQTRKAALKDVQAVILPMTAEQQYRFG